ncbi:hypothetical protein EVAR_67467_1 [Eumeta japonica]|uniref:Apple domain-containing protein n=1 Tax=Eumeta variegata TaxID=151549 RepID=A0A4C1ZPJ0_EUMVA|nr:hypothetical protein EVAR_67467_1 [Eumeta japonica]
MVINIALLPRYVKTVENRVTTSGLGQAKGNCHIAKVDAVVWEHIDVQTVLKTVPYTSGRISAVKSVAFESDGTRSLRDDDQANRSFRRQKRLRRGQNYDFYELDRNSLEPNCPTTLRGPGYLHSGYLTSDSGSSSGTWGSGYQSSQQSWRDRYDNWNRDRHYNRRHYDRYNDRYHGRRRYEDQFFVPYQIGLSRADDGDSNWGQYGGYYGVNYYNDRSEYKNLYNHWGFDEKFYKPNDFYGVRPYSNHNVFDYHNLGNGRFRNGWDNYGYGYGWNRRSKWNVSSYEDRNGLVYGESNYYGTPNKEVYYEEPVDNFLPAKDCSSRRKPGMSLSGGAIKRSLLARTVVDCEAACFKERQFKCVSYSYRYSKSHGSDNCFLSERPYRGLDMATDSGSDVYAMPQDSQCPANHRPWVESGMCSSAKLKKK